MAIQVSYPGVYIEEFAPGAPIQGVSTSTPAFIGIAARGAIGVPKRLTSWDSFRSIYGEQPVPGFYLWYAVRGFFENGGQTCYVVRVSHALYDTLTIKTYKGGKDLFVVRSREPGKATINFTIDREHLVDSTKAELYRPTGKLSKATSLGDKQLLLNDSDASQFRPGDMITVAAAGEHAQIVRISSDGTVSTLLVNEGLASAYSKNDVVRLDDTKSGATVFRLTSSAAIPDGTLGEGTMLTFNQGVNNDTQIVSAVQVERLATGRTTFRITLRAGLSFPVDMTAKTTVQSEECTISVKQGAGTTPYDGLGFDPAHARYYLKSVNDDPDGLVLITPLEPAPPIGMPDNLPAKVTNKPLTGGRPEDLTKLTDQEFISALDQLRDITGVNMVAVPDRPTVAVQQAVVQHCELLADRFAVLDCRAGLDPFNPTELQQQRAEVESSRGYAALYYPWLRVLPAGPGDPILVPPSGHICGIFARVDNKRGVHKAPANEIVNGAPGLERVLSDIDHGLLNLAGIDVVRIFRSGGRPVLFGARTTATDRNWQYVNIRRLFIYLEKSIQLGIAWAVFEPNNLQLWQKLRRSIGDFLNGEWRDGALFGAKAEDAYYVRIDEVLNPFSEQQLGRLHIEIGVRPSYPAEFIIVRIGIWQGGSEINES